MSDSPDITLGLATGDDDAHADAARVWAAAAAERDGSEPDERSAWHDIRGRLRMPGAQLIVALAGAEVVGFAVTVPQGDEGELFFLAVHPEHAGRGIAGRLLGAAESIVQRPHLRLWVIEDNERAIALYEAAGWSRADNTQVRSDGRTEIRYRKDLSNGR